MPGFFFLNSGGFCDTILGMTSQERKKVFVAMSGGVDSSVAVALLKERGFDVYGIHIKMWSPAPNSELKPWLQGVHRTVSPSAHAKDWRGVKERIGAGQADPVCQQQHQDRLDAMRVAAHLSVPFRTWDFTKEYKRAVVDYMVREYAAGRTPNPDVMCNREVKFGIFLKKALEQGADYIATGHYVRLEPSEIHSGNTLTRPATRSFSIQRGAPVETGDHAAALPDGFPNEFSSGIGSERTQYKLLKGKDGNKDQSYFLWTLTQDQLGRCLFPIGEYTKPKVRELARTFRLPTAEKEDSQGICFIGEINLTEFLKRYIPESSGPVVTAKGKAFGEHRGLSFYTIGQREGLGIGGGIPYYVSEKNFQTNTLVVAEGPYDENLFASEAIAADIHWISGKEPKFPLRCHARIRYRQPLQTCLVSLKAKSYKLKAVFDEPQRAVTPGQSIVFYQGKEMLGGGVIG